MTLMKTACKHAYGMDFKCPECEVGSSEKIREMHDKYVKEHTVKNIPGGVEHTYIFDTSGDAKLTIPIEGWKEFHVKEKPYLDACLKSKPWIKMEWDMKEKPVTDKEKYCDDHTSLKPCAECKKEDDYWWPEREKPVHNYFSYEEIDELIKKIRAIKNGTYSVDKFASISLGFFEEWLTKKLGPVVHSDEWGNWTEDKDDKSVKSAHLFNVQKIKKKCEHEIKSFSLGGMQTIVDGSLIASKLPPVEGECWKCGAKLKAEWREVE